MVTSLIPDAGFAKYGYQNLTNDVTVGITGSFSGLSSIFKEFYLPGIIDLLNSERVLSTYVQTRQTDISGKYAKLALRTGRNESTGMIEETGYLPEPGDQQYDEALYRVHYIYNRITFTGPAVASSRNSRGAFVSIMDAEMTGQTEDMQHEVNRIRIGDGSGALARFDSAGSSGNNFKLDNPGGFTNTGPGTQYVRPRMRVGFADDATGELTGDGGSPDNNGFHIIQVDETNDTIQIARQGSTTPIAVSTLTGQSLQDNDFLVKVSRWAGNRSLLDSGYNNEAFGIAALIDDGNPATRNVGNIDATATPVWNAPVIDNSGTAIPFNQGMLQRAINKLRQTSSGRVQLFFATYGLERAYLDTLTSQKRFVSTMDLDGGYEALTYNNIPIVPDKDATRGRIYGIDFTTLMDVTETDYFFLNQDGSVLERLPDRDAWQATLARYWNFATNARNRNVVIKDIQDD